MAVALGVGLVDALRQGRYLLVRVPQSLLLMGGLLQDLLAQDLRVMYESKNEVGHALLQPGLPVGPVVLRMRAGVLAAPVSVTDIVKARAVFLANREGL